MKSDPLTIPTFFSYSPEEGIEFHESADEARTRAEKQLDDAEFAAADSDWHWQENEDSICWGVVKACVIVRDRDLTPEEMADNPEWSFIRSLSLEDAPCPFAALVEKWKGNVAKLMEERKELTDEEDRLSASDKIVEIQLMIEDLIAALK